MTMNGDDAAKVVPVRHYGRLVGMVVVVVLLSMFVHTLFSRPSFTPLSCSTRNAVRTCRHEWRFGWDVVFRYFTSTQILQGLVRTLELTAIAMVTGIVIGVVIAVMRRSQSRLLSSTAWTYTWFFRGTPVLVQLLFWFAFNALYPTISIGIPLTHVTFFVLSVGTTITAFGSACIAFGLNEGAYFSEIVRAGLLAIDEGQTEAAISIGMTRGQTLRLIVLPQAMRVILPPTGNEVISMLKTTSLASAVGVFELLGAADNISAANFKTIDLLITASLWYLIVTTILSIGQFYLERHYAKGALRNPPPTPIQRIRDDLEGIMSKFHTKRFAGAEAPR
jgi:polar amino acid transport system permease protein